MDKHFFDTVRPLFGKLTTEQVDAMSKIVAYGKTQKTSKLHLAYILATVFHETGKWMVPIREGALRYGRNYTDAQSRRAVANIYAKGIIRTNYALPTGPYNQSYYGRGLVQITWYDNYVKFGIAKNPDKALEWKTALDILFRGMKKGMFTGKRLSMIRSRKDYKEARAIINGDVRKNGQRIADEADVFFNALKNYGAVTVKTETRKVANNVRYGFSSGTIRNQPVVSLLMSRLSSAILTVFGPEAKGVIYSGGQDYKGQGSRRTGSVRHDGGKAADLYVYIKGRKLQGLELAKLGQYWLAKKYGSVGLEMRTGGIHLDVWNPPPKGGGLLWTYKYSDNKPWGAGAKKMLVSGSRGVFPELVNTVVKEEPKIAEKSTEQNVLVGLIAAVFISIWTLIAYLWEYVTNLF